MHRFCLPLLILGLIALTGCQKPLRPGLLDDASTYYDRGQYEEALATAAVVARRGERGERDAAALIAGLAARQQGEDRAAEKYLRDAAESDQPALAGDALASLGLLFAEQERYERSAAALLRAAEFLQGQPRANAYFYAAVALQKLGRWAQARTSLFLARAASREPQFVQQVNDQLDVVGWTLQVGAFRDPDNAQEAAEQITASAREALLGRPRIVAAVDRDGQSLAVVQVGQFTTFQSASQARDRLGRNSAIIIPLAGR